MSKEELLKQIDEVDACLTENKAIIDKYAGKTREELGDQLFDALIEISEMSISLMVAKVELKEILLSEYGTFLMEGES